MKKVALVIMSLVLASVACVNIPNIKINIEEILGVVVEEESSASPTRKSTDIPTEVPEESSTNTSSGVCENTLNSLEKDLEIKFTKEDSFFDDYEYEYEEKIYEGVTVVTAANENKQGCVVDAVSSVFIDVQNSSTGEVEEAFNIIFSFAKYFDTSNYSMQMIGEVFKPSGGSKCEYGKTNTFTHEMDDGTIWEFECRSEIGNSIRGFLLRIKK